MLHSIVVSIVFMATLFAYAPSDAASEQSPESAKQRPESGVTSTLEGKYRAAIAMLNFQRQLALDELRDQHSKGKEENQELAKFIDRELALSSIAGRLDAEWLRKYVSEHRPDIERVLGEATQTSRMKQRSTSKIFEFVESGLGQITHEPDIRMEELARARIPKLAKCLALAAIIGAAAGHGNVLAAAAAIIAADNMGCFD